MGERATNNEEEKTFQSEKKTDGWNKHRQEMKETNKKEQWSMIEERRKYEGFSTFLLKNQIYYWRFLYRFIMKPASCSAQTGRTVALLSTERL